jgi:quercetin dioxygenase-like cupin family protein
MTTSLLSTYLRLKPDSSIEELPADGFWQRLMAGQLGNFHHEYLVTTSPYSASWQSWEKHPMGEEIVCLLSGRVTLIQERDGHEVRVELTEVGQYALNPRGTWHTADVHEDSLLLFITAGEATVTRPRT